MGKNAQRRRRTKQAAIIRNRLSAPKLVLFGPAQRNSEYIEAMREQGHNIPNRKARRGKGD